MALAYKKKTVIPAIWCRSGVLAAIMCVDDLIAAKINGVSVDRWR